MEIELYTAQECEFLDKLLGLFEVKANVKEVKDVVSYTLYVIDTDKDTAILIRRCMAYNYQKHFQ